MITLSRILRIICKRIHILNTSKTATATNDRNDAMILAIGNIKNANSSSDNIKSDFHIF